VPHQLNKSRDAASLIGDVFPYIPATQTMAFVLRKCNVMDISGTYRIWIFEFKCKRVGLFNFEQFVCAKQVVRNQSDVILSVETWDSL
jgi:hypothetical protein